MIVQRVVSDLLTSNMYIVIEGTGAVIIDPCRNKHMPEGIKPEMIILTHEHYDHISGVNAWRDKYNIEVVCSKVCGERMQSPKNNMARYFKAFCGLQIGLDNSVPEDYEPEYMCKADTVYEEDAQFMWRDHLIKLIILPGHSPGSAGIIIDNCLFAGDSVFENQDTVLKFPGGSERDWQEISLPKLKALPNDTIVYPGHFECFKLKDWNYY